MKTIRNFEFRLHFDEPMDRQTMTDAIITAVEHLNWSAFRLDGVVYTPKQIADKALLKRHTIAFVSHKGTVGLARLDITVGVEIISIRVEEV